MGLLDFLGDIPIIGDLLGGAEDYRRSKRLQEREHGLALQYAPKYFKEQQRQASATWLGEGAIGPDVTRVQQEATLGGRLDTVMDRGATLPEALGVGGGSNPQGPTAMLGNGPQQAAGRAMMANQRFQMHMQDRALKTQLQIASMQYGEGSPAERGAGVQERGVAIKEAMLSVERDLKTNLAKKAFNEVATSHISFVIDRIQATMHPDNIRGSLLAKAAQEDGVSIWSRDGKIDRSKLAGWLDQIRAQGSKTITEFVGIEDWANKKVEIVIEELLKIVPDNLLNPNAREEWDEFNRNQ